LFDLLKILYRLSHRAQLGLDRDRCFLVLRLMHVCSVVGCVLTQQPTMPVSLE
jgi:hypothetical protein